MDEATIFILTGPVHTGKTTELIKWSSDKNDVRGIATPVIEYKRTFLDLHTKELFPMEAEAIETNILTVGKYKFSLYSFDKAEKIIADGMKNNSGWLVIDEIGPLELQGEGFCKIVKEILKYEKRNFKLLLIIRDTILEDVLKFFDINKFELIGK